MASRQQTHEQKAALKRALREEFARGEWRIGAPAPSQRELAERFGMSHPVVAQVVRELVEEGLFHIRPRIGTFVGPPPIQAREKPLETFVFLGDGESPLPERERALRMGFEDGIARKGGLVLCVDKAQGREPRDAPPLASVGGVFEWALHLDRLSLARLFEAPDVARVFFWHSAQNNPQGESVRDSVSFDDFDGGRRATEHLLSLGHERIAFLGLHGASEAPQVRWSREREDGWRDTLNQRGLSGEGFSFHPSQAPALPYGIDHAPIGREVVRRFLQSMAAARVSAVVAANDRLATTLLELLREVGVARTLWPSVVSFDNEPALFDASVTSLRLPWDEVGQAAADLLWQRRERTGAREPQHRAIKMRLIPRLTCRADWPLSPAYAVLYGDAFSSGERPATASGTG